jgi:hypothetical protein
MEYCTLEELKKFLCIRDGQSDISLSNLITTLTSILDIEL